MVHINSMEIHAVYNCNLSCKDCMHFSPIEPTHYLSNLELKSDLCKINRIVSVDVLRLLGGEPLLHPNLGQLAKTAQASQIAKTISISTNGILLSQFADDDDLWSTVSECEVTLYPVTQKLHNSIIQTCCEISNKYGTLFSIYFCNSFRKSGSPQKHDDAITNCIFKTCIVSRQWQCFNLFEGKLFMCPQALSISRNIDLPNTCENYVDLSDEVDLENRIKQYVERPNPLPICYYCYGSCGTLCQHTQIAHSKFLDDFYFSKMENDFDFNFLDELTSRGLEYSSLKTVTKTLSVRNGLLEEK